MRTAGVDLAAEPKGTALAVAEWGAGRAELVHLQVGADDAAIVETTRDVDKLGIDCAFGWPDEFTAFLVGHAAGASPVPGGMEWRRTLAFRETDRVLRERTGRYPLSVSTDRLGLTAMRCAGLLGRLHADGRDVDRAGDGHVAEVYPGATLRSWGFDTRGYRTDPDVRRVLLAELLEQAPWLELGERGGELVRSDHAFDALVAALAARAAVLGLCPGPEGARRQRARREGWIRLPEGVLGDLAP